MSSAKKGLALVPPAARMAATTPTRREELARSAEAVNTFVATVGGRQRLLDTLATGAAAPTVESFLLLALDATYADYSLPELCSLAGLTVADLFRAFQDASQVRMATRTLDRLEQEMPAIVADVVRRAQPHEETCTTCHGTGTTVPKATAKVPNPSPGPCAGCGGTGTVHVLPDLDRQKLVLGMAGLLPKDGGGPTATANVLIHQSAPSAASAPGSLEALQQVVSEALYGRRAPAAADPTAVVTEAEIVPPEAPTDA